MFIDFIIIWVKRVQVPNIFQMLISARKRNFIRETLVKSRVAENPVTAVQYIANFKLFKMTAGILSVKQARELMFSISEQLNAKLHISSF